MKREMFTGEIMKSTEKADVRWRKTFLKVQKRAKFAINVDTFFSRAGMVLAQIRIIRWKFVSLQGFLSI